MYVGWLQFWKYVKHMYILNVYTIFWRNFMVYTKVFKSGNSQAVRIPKQFHLNSDMVEIVKRNNELILREKPKNLKKAFQLLVKMPDDFFSKGRNDDEPQEREF